jgi:hypothetical protein
VPVAVPDPPVELDHVIFATPTLSVAVPLTTSELAAVEILLLAGDRTVIEGGVVSGPGAGAGGGLVGKACWRVTR